MKRRDWIEEGEVMAKSIYYAILDDDPELVDRMMGPVEFMANVDGLDAELCAEHYHDYFDGRESGWPLTFVFFENEEGGVELGRFEVDRETVPEFHARVPKSPG